MNMNLPRTKIPHLRVHLPAGIVPFQLMRIYLYGKINAFNYFVDFIRASSRETRTHSKSGSQIHKKQDEVTAEDIVVNKDNMLVPMVPQTDSKRSSRKGGGSRAASRSSSPVGSVGIPDGDETDESEDLGRLHYINYYNTLHLILQ